MMPHQMEASESLAFFGQRISRPRNRFNLIKAFIHLADQYGKQARRAAEEASQKAMEDAAGHLQTAGHVLNLLKSRPGRRHQQPHQGHEARGLRLPRRCLLLQDQSRVSRKSVKNQN